MLLAAADFDGTLLIDRTISSRDLQAIARWQEAGNRFGIVTGRGKATLFLELPRFPLHPDFLVCNNGALILDSRAREVRRFPLPEDLRHWLLTENPVLARASHCAVFDGGSMYLLKGRHREWINPDYRLPIVTVEDALSRPLHQVSLAFRTREEAFCAGGMLERELAGRAHVRCSLHLADIVAKEAGKAQGIRQAVRLFGWTPSAIVAAGDDGNDRDMLEAFPGMIMARADGALDGMDRPRRESVADMLEELLAGVPAGRFLTKG